MQVPVQITLRDGIKHSEAIESHIQEKADKLQHFCHNIVACHVVVEIANKKPHNGSLHNTRITVTVPGKELVAKENKDENMYVSIRTAFDEMTRQLEEYVEQMRGDAKNPKPYWPEKLCGYLMVMDLVLSKLMMALNFILMRIMWRTRTSTN